MFEGYSLRAHQVLILARLKAGQRGADTLGTEDLLVALIIEDQGGCFKALSGLPAHRNSPAQRDPWPHQPFLPPDRANDLLARVEALCTRSQPVSAASDMSVSEGVMRAFAGAAGLSGELQQNEVEPLHLLAAIVGDEASRVAQVLRDAGITREKVVKAIREEATAVSKERLVMVERVGVAAGPPVYSKRALNLNFLARLKARTRGAGTIEIEDLLVALLIEDQGGFLKALSDVPGVAVDMAYVDQRPHRPFLSPDLANDLPARVEALCSRSQPQPPGADIPRSEGVKRAFAVAANLSGELQQSEIEPLHLLAAIVGTESSRSAQMFRDAGITPERIVKVIRGESA